MKYCMITFRSVTPAQRGEEFLRRAGILCRLSRTPRQMQEKGCGYCLRLPLAQLSVSLQRLEEAEIHWQRLYTPTETGDWEEVGR